TAVKRNQTGTTGANRIHKVLGNDTEIVKGYQETLVGKSRAVGVGGLQVHGVTGDIIVQGLSNQLVVTQKSFCAKTIEGSQVFEAKTGFMFRVDGGKSTILMTPTAIVIDAPKVYINPGDKVMRDIFSGTEPEKATEHEASEDRINKSAEALQK